MNVETSPTTLVREWADGDAPALPRAKEPLRLRLYAGLMALDVVALTLGFGIATALRYGPAALDHGGDMLPLIAPLYLVLAFNNRAYSLEALLSRRHGIVRALSSLLLTVIAIVFIGFYLRASTDLSRLALTGGGILAALLLAGGRMIFHGIAGRMCGDGPLSVVLLTDGATCATADGALIVDAPAAGLSPDIRDPLMLDRLGRFLRNADRVVVACPPERRMAWGMALKGANIRGEIIEPGVAALGTLGVDTYGTESTLVVSTGPLALRGRMLKRSLDLSLALAALIFAAPVLLLTALAIAIEDGGPILFVQQRLGRGNRLFSVYKFRSMKPALCDDAGAKSTSHGDTRVTRVGRFIRSTSIDELPQLLNILKGNMSFVGPRPHALGSLAGDLLFWEVDQRYWHRHASKPGLTGLAQVRGFRGATWERSDLVNRLQADLEYVNDWSIWRDLRILAATVKVLIHRNAF